ncbi:hypothetical protein MMC16_007098 [Acarospora aff. strigata]|nr:hypothetical protein [Acarospora aff. strigata]
MKSENGIPHSDSPPGEVDDPSRTNQAATEVEKDLSSTPVEPARKVQGFAWFLVVVSILSSIFTYALDNTIVADIVPAILNELGGIEKLPWLSVGFMIGGVAMVMPFGKLYGMYNAKWLYIISSVVFLAASALCGAAPNMDAMIIGRVFAGAGGNGMYLGVLTLLSVNTTNKERPAYLSLIGLVWGTGTVLGPVVGGGFEKVDWRWSFYINLIIGGIFAPVYLFVLPPFDPSPGTPYAKRAAKFDYVGAILSVAAFVCLIMAISFGGALYAWNSGQIIALFVVAAVLWAVFSVQQFLALFTTVDDRMFPVHLLKNKEAILLFLLMATGATAAFVPIYYIPIHFQFTQGDSALASAIRLLPFIFVLSAMILLNGGIMSRIGYYKPWYVGGTALGLIGAACLSRIDVNTSTAKIYGFEILIGIGTGAYAQAGYAVIQAVTEPSDMSYAISFMLIAQLGGIGFSLAICGAVFLNDAQRTISAILPGVPVAQIRQAILGTSSAFLDTLPAASRALTLDALVMSLRKVFIPVYVATAIGFLASLFLSNKRAFVPIAAGG